MLTLVMSLAFNMEAVPLSQLQDDGLSANECYPQTLVNDPTFALLNSDNYFVRNNRAPGSWAQPPTPAQINGRNPPYPKRGIEFPQDQFAWDDGNSSRPFTENETEDMSRYLQWEEEQAEKHDSLGYVECRGGDCATEITPWARYVLSLMLRLRLSS